MRPPGRRRRGPLIELELADQVEQRIQRLLDEFGGAADRDAARLAAPQRDGRELTMSERVFRASGISVTVLGRRLCGDRLIGVPVVGRCRSPRRVGPRPMTYATGEDGTRLHYRVTGRGSGPPVLLIQGLGADKHGWDLQRLALAWRYRTIAFDNRGAGRSDKPHGTYTLEQMAADAIAVLDHAGVETAHVVGASMGGAISQIVALRLPRAGPLADAGVHVVPQPRVAPGTARRVGRGRRDRGHGRDDERGGALGDRAAVVPPVDAGRSAGSDRWRWDARRTPSPPRSRPSSPPTRR